MTDTKFFTLCAVGALLTVAYFVGDKAQREEAAQPKHVAQANAATEVSSSRRTISAGARTPDPVSQSASRFMDDINEKVIGDAEREYQIASRSGNDVDRCVHAGMVAAAYIQAHNQSGYQSWKMREEMDCHR